jgi:hypothetical protein
MVQPAEVAGSIVQRNKVVAKRKGLIAAVAGGVAAGLFVVGAPIVGAVGVVGAAYFGWDWLSFRIKNGMRF